MEGANFTIKEERIFLNVEKLYEEMYRVTANQDQPIKQEPQKIESTLHDVIVKIEPDILHEEPESLTGLNAIEREIKPNNSKDSIRDIKIVLHRCDHMLNKLKKRKKRKPTVTELYRCDHCDYTTRYTARFQKHQLLHPKEGAFSCDRCNCKFSFLNYLKQHERVAHFGGKPLQCDACGYACKTSTELEVHKLKHAGKKPIKCDECDYECLVQSVLRIHKLKHKENKLYKCIHCDYQTSYIHNFQTHTLNHSKEKMYKCDECDYSTSVQYYLKTHKMYHLEDKPFVCKWCGYKCSHSGSFNRHLLIHTAEDNKKFKCDQCDKAYCRSTALKFHKMTHSSQEILTCAHCNYKCLKPETLRRHELMHSDRKTFHCDLCDYVTKQPDYLKRHLSRRHPAKKPASQFESSEICSLPFEEGKPLENQITLLKSEV